MTVSERLASTVRWLQASRPGFLLVSGIAAGVGIAQAQACGCGWDPLGAVATLLLTLLTHAGVNLYNDYGDALGGSDALNTDRLFPFSGGSRVIQDGVFSAQQVRDAARGLAIVVVGGGLLLAARAGPGLLLIGAAGLLLGWAYSSPRVALMSRGWGELSVAAGWWLIVVGADYVQRHAFSTIAAVSGVSVGLLVAGILWAAEFPDARADAQAGKRTLVVRWGPRPAAAVYLLGVLAAHAWVAAWWAADWLPSTAWWALGSLPLSLAAAGWLWRRSGQVALRAGGAAATRHRAVDRRGQPARRAADGGLRRHRALALSGRAGAAASSGNSLANLQALCLASIRTAPYDLPTGWLINVAGPGRRLETRMSEPLVLSAQTDAVRTLTLNRPAALNSFTGAMHRELLAALNAAADDPGVRAVVLTGAGRGFCAGQDLNDPEMAADAAGEVAVNKLIEAYYRPLALRVRSMPVPVVAAVNGVAAGAGANLALGCDLVVAARSASFIQAFSKIGLVPDCGGTWLLPRLVGRARALGLAMTGDKLPAEEAQRIGLIWQVADDAALADTAMALAQRLAALPVKALAATRRALDDAMAMDLDSAVQMEGRLQGEYGRAHDYREGVAAFQQKRAPRFTDR